MGLTERLTHGQPTHALGRFITVALGSVREYVLLAQQQQQIQAPVVCIDDNDSSDDFDGDSDRAATAGSDDERASRRRRTSRYTSSNNDSTPLDSEALDGCARLLLSINVLTAANARAIASQQVGMERPVAVSRRNPRLLRDVCARVDACLSRAHTQAHTQAHTETQTTARAKAGAAVTTQSRRTASSSSDSSSGSNDGAAETAAVSGHVADALVRALEWFADSSFAVSVIAPADAIAGLSSSDTSGKSSRQTGALASALRRLGSVQFVLHRSDDERPERAARNILHLLGAIRDSGNARCEVRQVEDVAFQMRGVVVCLSVGVCRVVSTRSLGHSFIRSCPGAGAWTLMHLHTRSCPCTLTR